MPIIGKTKEIENHIASRSTYVPTTYSFGLLLSTSTLARTGGNEVVAHEPMGGYERFVFEPSDWNYDTNSGWGEYTLNREIHFGLATEPWINVRFLALFCDNVSAGEGTLLRAVPIAGGNFTVNNGEGVCFNHPLLFRVGKDSLGNPQQFRRKIADYVLGISTYPQAGLWIGLLDTATNTEIGMRVPAPASLIPTFVSATSWITRWGSMSEDVVLSNVPTATNVKWFLSAQETGFDDSIWYPTAHPISASCESGPFLPRSLGQFYNILGGAFWGGI